MKDVSSYLTQKADGLNVIIKTGEVSYALLEKRFDPKTGKEIDPELTPVYVEEIEGKITVLQNQIAALQAILDDIKSETTSTVFEVAASK